MKQPRRNVAGRGDDLPFPKPGRGRPRVGRARAQRKMPAADAEAAALPHEPRSDVPGLPLAFIAYTRA
eukprot:8133810-Lingulodinium_polyedra.AAC.1